MDSKTASILFQKIEREVWIVTAAVGERRAGLVATFVNPASIVPEMPRVIVGIAKTHETRSRIQESGAFALHLVGESQLELVWRFGLQSSRDTDKFSGLQTSRGPTGSPILSDALAWLDCRVESQLDTGDRTVFLAEVVESALLRDAKPLNLQRLLQLASKDKLDVLRAQMQADAAKDAQAIASWRQAQH